MGFVRKLNNSNKFVQFYHYNKCKIHFGLSVFSSTLQMRMYVCVCLHMCVCLWVGYEKRKIGWCVSHVRIPKCDRPRALLSVINHLVRRHLPISTWVNPWGGVVLVGGQNLNVNFLHLCYNEPQGNSWLPPGSSWASGQPCWWSGSHAGLFDILFGPDKVEDWTINTRGFGWFLPSGVKGVGGVGEDLVQDREGPTHVSLATWQQERGCYIFKAGFI